jgi:L-amino acid N-acyltransferase YncA
MAHPDYAIASATPDDIPGIVALQECNMRDKGGALSVRLPAAWLEATIAEMPTMVAHREGRVVGYTVSSPISAQADIPIVKEMLRTYPGSPGAYIYGPICVAAGERGQGVADAMVEALRKELPKREGFTFIRADNAVSREVHRKLGMREAAHFTHGGEAYVVVAYIG